MTALRGFAVHYACKRRKIKPLREESQFSDFRMASLVEMKCKIILCTYGITELRILAMHFYLELDFPSSCIHF